MLTPRTWIEIDTNSLNHNINTIKSLIPATTKLALVVKSNAYGHGIEAVKIMDAHKDISLLCTAGLEEAVELRKNGITKPILAMSYLDADLELIVSHTIEIAISTYKEFITIKNLALQKNIPISIHLKVDTGLSRRGFTQDHIYTIISMLSKQQHIKVVGIFTHLADNKGEHPDYTAQQLALFNNIVSYAQKILGCSLETHAQASACLPCDITKEYSLMRVGSAAYGIYKSDKQKEIFKAQGLYLVPVLRWKTTIIEIKMVPAGNAISYGCITFAEHNMHIGILPIGYYDGYPTALSSKGMVKIKNQYAPVVGRVTMNMILIDLTKIQNVHVGDEVTLIGDDEELSPRALAKRADMVSIEILSGLLPAIRRTILSSETQKEKKI